MAKVVAPLMSFEASGSIAKAITFMGWRGQARVRQYFIPQNPSSAAQVTVRSQFSMSKVGNSGLPGRFRRRRENRVG